MTAADKVVEQPLAEVWRGLRFFARLPAFLRRPMGVAAAREELHRRLNNRPSDFAEFVASIYAELDSPYRALLQMTGCEHGDFIKLIASEGIEGSLSILARQGVYLTIDEFKGRTPVVRGSFVLNINPSDLSSHAAAGHLTLRSGGSRGQGTPVPVDLAYVRDRAVSSSVAFETRGAHQWTHGVWGMWGRAGMVVLLELSAFGAYPAVWFSQVDPGHASVGSLYRWSAQAMRVSSILAGKRSVTVRHVPIDQAVELARWMAAIRHEGGTPHLHTHASSAVRVCEAADAAGLDIRGAQFTAASEPMTAARMRAIRMTGAHAWPQYASVESGVIGLGCANPAQVDDVHFLHDRFAIIQTGGEHGLPDHSLLISSLRQTTAPFALLNVSLGDQAMIAKRVCGCPLERLGWHTHIHSIRSHEKLTAGGMNFLDRDIIRVLEEVMPVRFGGGPTDYQLLEEVADDGQSRLRLLVSPSLGPLDPGDLAEAFLTGIGADSGSQRIASLLWRDAGFLSVERTAPVETSAGKILHIHRRLTEQPESGY